MVVSVAKWSVKEMLPFVELEIFPGGLANQIIIKKESEKEIFKSIGGLVRGDIGTWLPALAMCDKVNADTYNYRQEMCGKSYCMYITPGVVKVVRGLLVWDVTLTNEP